MVSRNSSQPYSLEVDQDHLVFVVVELDNDHPVPISWSSQDDATGHARVLLNAETGEIYRMELVVEGISASGGANPLQDTPLQSFHFHNFPQIENPDFYVQQLYDVDEAGLPTTATLENTGDGFVFVIDQTYALRDPVNNPALGVDFVIDEILAGNGYLGVHTAALPIPATAIAGDMIVLSAGGLDGTVLYFGDDDDKATGSQNADLISAGGGSDLILGLKGDDVLDGGAGDDFVSGMKGDDTLYGGIGDDILSGGQDEDLLRGGEGRDTFVYGTQDGMDTIVDFELGEDAILLKGRARDYDLSLVDADGDGLTDDSRLATRDGWIDVLDTDLASLGHEGFLA